MRFEIAADTDRGIVKETNQDSLLVKCFSTCKGDMAFAVLCDGMGGLSKGELASATVVRAFDRWSDEQLPELCKSSNPDIDSLILERQWDEVIQQQNEKIKAYGKAHAVNMGTTVVALLVTQKAYYIINVGDSRIYSLSDHIERLTTDQTYVQREIMNGNMTQEQAMRDPRRNVLLQCVGASAEVKPEYRTGAMKNGMSLLLCSDGFRHEVSEQEIYEMLKTAATVDGQNMHDRLEQLIRLSMQRGERDNITAALIKAQYEEQMLEIGSLIDGKYKILNEVGHGGMSVVYLAMNERANKQWAIKEVRKDGVKDFEVVKQSLVAETNMLKKLSHPSLPDIVDVIDEDDRFLIVMDYIDVNSLKTALQEYGDQTQKNVIKWAKQLCDVLGYLHSQNPQIIYRDMKPANIMLKPDGNVVLIDFGTAREYKENNIEDTTCLGTMGYAAPEQFGGMGQTDARTDIYCLGATMYHLVTGMNPCEPPYEIRPIREIDPTLSGGLERIITKCTQPDPNNRYQSAAELMYDLEHYTEIDDMYRKNLKRKLAVFITTSALTLLLGTSTVLSYCAAEHKKNENYNSILKEADTYDNYDNGYYTAIVTDPTRTEAYLKLNDKLTDDFVLDRDEAQILNRLMVGIDCKDHNGRVHTYDVMAKLKEKNPKGYEDVCYKIGESFLFYYEINVEKDRYSSAAQWFKEVKENHPEAGIYCEISDCLTLISQYDGAKIQQTEKTYEEYKKLWKQINELYAKSENFDSLDAKIQVWNEIDDIVDTNITSFIAVTDKDKVMDLLQTIKDKTEKLDKSIMREQITGLQDNIDKTIEKAQSVKEENKDDL